MKKKYIAAFLSVALSGLSCIAFAGCGHKHSYESFYQPATCMDRGYTLHSCTECSYQYADDFVEPYEHAYENCYSLAVPVKAAQAVSARSVDYISFEGLPLCKPIGQPVCEVVKGQPMWEQLMNDWLKKEYEQSQSQSNSMETFVFQKAECPFCGDGEIKVHKITIDVPLLATVPVPNNIDINNGTVVATMDITPSADHSPAFSGEEHGHCFDIWPQSSDGSPKVNSATVASVPTDYSVKENGELTVDVIAGSSEVKLAANANPAQIRQMTMADTIEEIEANAFESFTDLRRVELPDNLKKIDTNAFGVAKLDFIIIPNSLKEIGANAFGNCSQMKYVFYFGTEAEWNGITFDNANDPLKSVQRYYFSEQKPTTSGNFWHFVNSEPTLW